MSILNANIYKSNFDTTAGLSVSESTFEEIPYYEQTIKDIIDGNKYTCMICTVEMDPYCQMYNCPKCYRVYDFECIKQWATKSIKKNTLAVANNNNTDHQSHPQGWKCPNCYYVSKRFPKEPTCWCGKNIKPEPNVLSPNSCGQTCENKAHCEHGCMKTCHLGPHQSCSVMIDIYCNCGSESKKILCSSLNPKSSKNMSWGGNRKFNCGKKCGLLMPCGVHYCDKICHSGPCGKCTQLIYDKGKGLIKCYCGLENKSQITCSDINVIGSSKNWVGSFACNNKRFLKYDCNIHEYCVGCEPVPKSNKKIHCPYSPDILKACPCGATSIPKQKRTNCTDPIPTCENVCEKPLKCGKHKCPYTCHNGPCMDPCLIIEKTACACNSKTFLTPCGYEATPSCTMKCEQLMSCKRHHCRNICCEGKPAAIERAKHPIFNKNLKNDESLVEAVHICLKPCNLKLSCGLHYCQRKCHPGKCPPCLESDSNDLVCPCGKTIIPAPVRCGTKLPTCLFDCLKVGTNRYGCNHKIPPHLCHEGECPKCTHSVIKKCRCYRHEKIRTLCYQTDVSCGKQCLKPLPNCPHKCTKICHTDSCLLNCSMICGLTRESCGHKCVAKCHGNKPCDEVGLNCEKLVDKTCPCGRIKSLQVKCFETKCLPPINCDETCAALKRRLELKKALGLDHSATNGVVVTASTTFEDLNLPHTEQALLIYHKQSAWCNEIDKTLKNFISENTKMSFHFKPMKAPQRFFIHELCKSYQLYSESQDYEPKRSVFVKKNIENGNIKSVSPIISLEESYKVYSNFREQLKKLKIQYHEANVSKEFYNLPAPEPATVAIGSTKYNCIVVQCMNDSINKKCNIMNIQEIFDKFLRFSLIGGMDYFESLYKSERKCYIVKPIREMNENIEKDMKMLLPHITKSLHNKYGEHSVVLGMGKVDQDANNTIIIFEEQGMEQQEDVHSKTS
ncbi:related to FKBP12-associated protein 1 [Saccharomycodes ludwigii]|uniref:Related to FKBP12-associated protein 1 n=1 Tax=Saccharomycodes ludwigii TaxID=36035 RepID=A0A376BB32_9ASCO|nr:hypothetical protein SCDLUD_002758 [Saccharomycodes ludwigii]KAH3901269.1 hypothetical protein SCDLUD_002758 [Saccharomycodes ludwigii]SSD61882.1 related to FKBP12-associated protein 1 [Saccharomycodes ludwigii]